MLSDVVCAGIAIAIKFDSGFDAQVVRLRGYPYWRRSQPENWSQV